MEKQTVEALFENFTEALTVIAGAPPNVLKESEGAPGSYRPDFTVEMSRDGEPYRLVVEAKSSLFPRDAREAIWQFRNYLALKDSGGYPVIPVLMAETISPGARQLLRDERIGYFDSSGSLFIAAKGLYLRVDKPASRKQSRSLNNVFAGQRAQVLHAAWVAKSDWFGVHELAERAGVSPTTTSETLIAVERREWIEVRGAGPSKERRLINPRALLDAWSAYQSSVKPKVLRHYYVRSTAPPELLRRLDHACHIEGIPYELTGISAGQIHAPYLSNASQVSCRIPSGQGMHAVMDAIEARPVRDGWNLGVHELKSDDELRFRCRIDDLWVADPLQTYLDLLQAGGRAKELAQHLRSEKLGV
ncbi:hypothetical protein [Rhizobium sp. PP-F2F-G48]|uniref:hypothetical protein n=1 Tax=Rhizobium sp. PP-F2F-G48 TaxID=2135651 RepID=UPI0010533816|nr:hypothetical protein [Rhizobium sp. PP-F2F-G48]